MKTPIKMLLCATAVTTAVVAHADVTPTDGFSVNAWQGTPTYLNYNTNPLNTNPGGAFVGEQNFGTGGAGFGSLMNTFTLGTSGNLSSIQLLLGGAATTYTLTLYSLSPSYVQSGSNIDPTTLTIAYSTAGISFTAPNTGAAGVTVINFTGADQVSLAAGNYGLAITPTSGSFSWFRGGADTFAGDELYRFNGTVYGPINGSGSPYRHAAFAVTVTPVPEPATMALLGFGALVGTFVVRRRK
jgi:hypothetical protein